MLLYLNSLALLFSMSDTVLPISFTGSDLIYKHNGTTSKYIQPPVFWRSFLEASDQYSLHCNTELNKFLLFFTV